MPSGDCHLSQGFTDLPSVLEGVCSFSSPSATPYCSYRLYLAKLHRLHPIPWMYVLLPRIARISHSLGFRSCTGEAMALIQSAVY